MSRRGTVPVEERVGDPKPGGVVSHSVGRERGKGGY